MAAPTTDTNPPRHPDPAVRRLAAALGETEPQPLTHLARIVRTLGEERAAALLEQALAIEQQGGQLLPDGSRRRTTGGVFFRLVREQATPAERARIWPWTRGPKPRATDRAPGAAT